MKLSDLIRPDGLLLDVSPGSKDALLQMLAAKAAELWGIDEAKIAKKLHEREDLGSTGIGGGIALPHCPCADLAAPALILARLKPAINFHAVDERPVDLVLMMLLPKDSASQHINVLSVAARALRDPRFAKAVRAASAEDMPAVLQNAVIEEKREAE